MTLGAGPAPLHAAGGLPARRGEQGLDVFVRSIPKSADLVFIALHGGAGENGTLQALLDLAGIPYTGSGVLSSALAMDKVMSKRIFKVEGIPTPEWVERWAPEDPTAPWNPEITHEEIARLGGYPLIVKPNEEGSSVGITMVTGAADLKPAMEEARRYGRLVLVEQFIEGRELTVGVIGQRALPVVEIIPEAGWYDYEHKYTSGRAATNARPASARGGRGLFAPASAPAACSHERRRAGRLPPRRGRCAHCLEVNTVPGLTELSLVPKAAQAADSATRTWSRRSWSRRRSAQRAEIAMSARSLRRPS
jgi:D-alanine-D-alanine ligase